MHAVKLALSGSTVFGGWSSVSPLSPPIHFEEPWEMGAFVWGTTILVTTVALWRVAPADTLINPARSGGKHRDLTLGAERSSFLKFASSLGT